MGKGGSVSVKEETAMVEDAPVNTGAVTWASADAAAVAATQAGAGRGRRDPTLTSRGYTVVLEADITACFDEIDHRALMGRVRKRIADKPVLALVKAFLHAGVLSQLGEQQDS